MLLLAAGSAAQAQIPPPPSAPASAPIDKGLPQPRSPSERRDSADPPGELRPDKPVVPQIDIPIGRAPAPTAPLSKERQARAAKAAAAGGLDDSAARCLAQRQEKDRAQCRMAASRPASAASRSP